MLKSSVTILFSFSLSFASFCLFTRMLANDNPNINTPIECVGVLVIRFHKKNTGCQFENYEFFLYIFRLVFGSSRFSLVYTDFCCCCNIFLSCQRHTHKHPHAQQQQVCAAAASLARWNYTDYFNNCVKCCCDNSESLYCLNWMPRGIFVKNDPPFNHFSSVEKKRKWEEKRWRWQQRLDRWLWWKRNNTSYSKLKSI